jgi:hypothetical protein
MSLLINGTAFPFYLGQACSGSRRGLLKSIYCRNLQSLVKPASVRDLMLKAYDCYIVYKNEKGELVKEISDGKLLVESQKLNF